MRHPYIVVCLNLSLIGKNPIFIPHRPGGYLNFFLIKLRCYTLTKGACEVWTSLARKSVRLLMFVWGRLVIRERGYCRFLLLHNR